MCDTLCFKRIHPPTIWRDYILEDVRIAYNFNGLLYTSHISDYSQRLSDFIGLCVPKFGRLIYPEMLEKTRGDNSKTYAVSEEEDYTSLECGLELTRAAYNDSSNANKNTNCAVGHAQNFERYVSNRGIPKGSWYIPTKSEAVTVIAPIYKQLQYAASLLGFSWSTNQIWTINNADSAASAYQCLLHRCNCQSVAKTSTKGVLLMAKMPSGVLPTKP